MNSVPPVIADVIPPVVAPADTPQSSSQPSGQGKWISLCFWLSMFSDGVASIVVPLYFNSIGVPAHLIGVTFVACELFGLIANLLSGLIANRYGYKFALLAGLALHSLASLGYMALDSTWPVLLLITGVSVLRAASGAGRDLMKTIASAYLKSSQERRYKFASIQFTFGGQEMIRAVGIALGAYLYTLLTFQGLFLLLGLATLLCLALAFFLIGDHRETMPVSLSSLFQVRKNLHRLAIARSFVYAGRDVWLVVAMPIHLKERGVATLEIGLVMAAAAFVYGLNQPLGVFLIKKEFRLRRFALKRSWRFRDTLAWSTGLSCVIPMLPLVFRFQTYGLYIAIITTSAVIGWVTAAHNHLHLKYSKRQRSAMDISYYKTVSQTGKVFALLLSGYLYRAYGLSACLIASSVLLLLACLICIKLRKVQKLGVEDDRALAS